MPRLGLVAPALLAAVALFAGGCSDPDGDAPAAAGPSGPAPMGTAPTAGPEKITVTHILIGFKNPNLARITRSEAQALELAKSIMADIASGRRKFEELALAFSDDRGEDDKLHTNNEIPGSYTMGRKMMVKEFEDAAFSTPVGQLAPEPVKTQYGFHIIRRDK